MSKTSLTLNGKIALITGGGTGIGFMTAKAFAAQGAKVYITGRRLQVLENAAASVKNLPGSLVAMHMDIIDEASVLSCAKKVEEADGKLNILINNAGQTYSSSDPEFGNKKMTAFIAGDDPFGPETMDNWVDVFKVNTIAPFFIIKAFKDLLLKGAAADAGSSAIINISSCVASMNKPFAPACLAYGPAKSAGDHLTTILAAEFASKQVPIRVNAIQPGLFSSELISDEILEMIKTEPVPGLVAPIPGRRTGTAEEISGAALFLATTVIRMVSS
ncbi:hypothetical protein CPB85DRAFT_1413073 [Mucidula mucida]|nr:hypothetical protein CPB85DRAFT_1413073 [Mucidula mucida]